MTALDNLAAAADEVANDQRQVARAARAMRRQRSQGLTWSTILDRPPGSSMLPLLARSLGRAVDAAGAFRRSVVEGLAAEGLSRRQIARLLGVTHQRVSALLRQSNDA